jgi:uncharacterized protein
MENQADPTAMRKFLTKAVFGLVFLYILLCGLLWWNQRSFFFRPRSEYNATPKFYGAAYEDVTVPVASGTPEAGSLRGWWIPGHSSDAPVVLYLHGNGFNVSANAAQARRFQHLLGLSVLLMDYRGYGKSSGSFPTETRVYEDAEATWNELVYKRHIPPNRIIIYGHSLGGAVAIETAKNHPNAAALIVESSFTSVEEMVRRQPWTRFFPVELLLNQHFDSIAKVPDLKMPVLFIHGRSDRLIPEQMSIRLYAASPEPKQIFLVDGAGHSNCAAISGKFYFDQLRSFLKKSHLVSG